jgi:dTDP-4-amino-4,6-dideoxygalactose transaminase
MATAACGEVLSLPMYPSLGEAEIEDVAMSVASFPED